MNAMTKGKQGTEFHYGKLWQILRRAAALTKLGVALYQQTTWYIVRLETCMRQQGGSLNP
jgi:hypothetical protein